jgi:hypothetical protein
MRALDFVKQPRSECGESPVPDWAPPLLGIADDLHCAQLDSAFVEICNYCVFKLKGCRAMSNIRGKAYAMNVITPQKSWKSWILRVAFALLTFRFTQLDLRKLSFIHFARWTILPRNGFPHFPTQTTRERLKFDYLLFESNFNGSWNEYVDAFNTVLAFKLNLVWYWSENYPGSRPLSPFKAYIEHNQKYNDYYYMAYPGSTVSDVNNALSVADSFAALSKAAYKSDREFAEGYQRFLSQVQNKLGSNGGPGPQMT